MKVLTKEELKLKTANNKLAKVMERKLKAAEKKLAKVKETASNKLAKASQRQEKRVLKLKEQNGKEGQKQLMNRLWKLISPIVRNKSDTCYTCDKYLEFKKRSAGHFWTKKGHPAVRFDLDNLRVQCDDCNRWKSGNCAEYGYRLRKELGEERYEALYLKKGQKKKWTLLELEELITYFSSL